MNNAGTDPALKISWNILTNFWRFMGYISILRNSLEYKSKACSKNDICTVSLSFMFVFRLIWELLVRKLSAVSASYFSVIKTNEKLMRLLTHRFGFRDCNINKRTLDSKISSPNRVLNVLIGVLHFVCVKLIL